MTKTELIDLMAKEADINKVQAAAAMTALIDGITMAVKDDGKLTLTGFGTFSKVSRKARKGVNPQTGKEIQIQAQTSVKFTAGKNLKESI